VGCSFGADQVAHPGHLHARDTTLAFAARAPQAEIQRLKERHGWNHIPWFTITDDFDKDFDVDEWHGTNPTPGTTSTSPLSAARRRGRTRRRATRKHRRTSGGTTTTCMTRPGDRVLWR
jgi:predicted dithiol-disulfide oxidoreductase (DUF899 family)